MAKKINKIRLLRNLIIGVLAIAVIGVYFSNRYIKTKGFDNLSDFISTYRTNKKLIEGTSPKSLTLFTSDKNYKFLENKRQEALDRGIQINRGDNYVKCKLLLDDGDTVKGEMRLKGHMTDHLEGDKWSFRVKTKKDEVMGMYRFSLQNPATRNYAYEWVYHQLLKKEEVIHLKYDFIQLNLNDKDLGIYAIEEHFGQHIPRDNQRPPGAILRWNPELYWENRIDELDGVYLDETYSGYEASFAEAYDRGTVKRDKDLIKTYQKGIQLLEEFRRGLKITSQVFDIEKMARFHAVIDLVGGYHSLDWSDVKFYYNSDTKFIEPVGYESFSVRETIKIAGQRTPEDYATIGFDYHDKLFADPVFFEAYIQNLERICNEAYFADFAQSIQKELDEKRGVLAREFAYIKFSFQPYYDNIELIRRNLELPKPFHAFVGSNNDSTLTINITPVSDFPIEIIELSVDGKQVEIRNEFVLPAKARDTYAHYYPLTIDYDVKKLKKLKLKARIPGSKNMFEVSVSDLPAYEPEFPAIQVNESLINDRETLAWINDSIAVLNKASISNQIIIPKNKKLYVNSGQEIVFEQDGQFIIEGELHLFGATDNQINVSSKKEKNTSIYINGGKLIASNAVITDLNSPLIQIDSGTLSFQTCFFAEINAQLLYAKQASINFINCGSGSVNGLGIYDRCTVKIKSFNANHGTTFLTAYGSDVELKGSKVRHFDQLTNLNYNSNFSTWNSTFDQIGLMGELNNASIFNCYAGSITKSIKGFTIDYKTELVGKSNYLLYKTNTNLDVIEDRNKEV